MKLNTVLRIVLAALSVVLVIIGIIILKNIPRNYLVASSVAFICLIILAGFVNISLLENLKLKKELDITREEVRQLKERINQRPIE